MNGHFRRCFWLYDGSFATIDCRMADLDSCLGRRGRLTAGLRATRQWNLVAPINLLWFDGRSFVTVYRRRADLDSCLGCRRRLIAWLEVTRQRNLVSPVALF
ncbi:hypothetical protein ACFX1X_013689 [Malus domestica]